MANTAIRGLLLAAQGEHDLAAGELERALALQRAAGRRISIGIGSMVPPLALSLAATDRRDAALELAAGEVEAARAYGAPSHLGAALRTLGLISGTADRIPRLEEAVSVLAGGPAALEHARALHALGGARLAEGDAAAGADLRAAIEIAERCGAERLAEAARAELAAAGIEVTTVPVVPEALLTPGERRAARLAADGLDDLGIAQALLTTVPSVRAQLAAAQAKLGVSDRSGLGAALA
jgi:DNA-binding CsgD family transcriptional regulator